MSTIGTPDDLLDAAELLSEIAGALRRRSVVVGEDEGGRPIRQPAPFEAQADVLDQVAVEIAFRAKAPGDWPHGVLSKGRVLVWAGSVMSVVHFLKEAVGDDLAATQHNLRITALRLQGHATGLRGTGEWAVVGEMTTSDLPDPEPAAPLEEVHDEVDSGADTNPMMVIDDLDS